jgi:hypothetical protein
MKLSIITCAAAAFLLAQPSLASQPESAGGNTEEELGEEDDKE